MLIHTGVDMDEIGPGIPTDATPLHQTRDPHRLLEPRVEADVERSAIAVLAVVSDAESGPRQRAIGRDATIGRQHGCTAGADGLHQRRKKVYDTYVDRNLLAGVMVAQQKRELLDGQANRSEVVPIGPVEGFLCVHICEPDAAEGRCGQRMHCARVFQEPASKSKETTPKHSASPAVEAQPRTAESYRNGVLLDP